MMTRVAVLAFALAMLAAQITYACKCARPPEPKKALQQSHAAFVGKVTEIAGDDRNLTVTLDVSATWKGVEQKSVIVHTPSHSAACGFRFEKGKEYLVYAYLRGEEGAPNRQLGTNTCKRTRLLDDKAREEMEELGPAKMPPAE